MSPRPCPPTPTTAKRTVSLGGVSPLPATILRGTRVRPPAAAAAFRRKRRRLDVAVTRSTLLPRRDLLRGLLGVEAEILEQDLRQPPVRATAGEIAASVPEPLGGVVRAAEPRRHR
jgi:hypothetical protein